jgi:hypothetical protein
MAQLSSYILTLQGTNPVGGLPPKGTKMETSTVTDSTKTADVKTDSLVTASK